METVKTCTWWIVLTIIIAVILNKGTTAFVANTFTINITEDELLKLIGFSSILSSNILILRKLSKIKNSSIEKIRDTN